MSPGERLGSFCWQYEKANLGNTVKKSSPETKTRENSEILECKKRTKPGFTEWRERGGRGTGSDGMHGVRTRKEEGVTAV